MTCNPCAGHTCDHCVICDGQGICCATVSRRTVSSVPNQQQDLDVLRTAMATDRTGEVNLVALVRAACGTRAGGITVVDASFTPALKDDEVAVANPQNEINIPGVVRALPASTVPDSHYERTTQDQVKEVIRVKTARTYP